MKVTIRHSYAKKSYPTIHSLSVGAPFRFRTPVDYDNLYMRADGGYIHLNTGRFYKNCMDREVVPTVAAISYVDDKEWC